MNKLFDNAFWLQVLEKLQTWLIEELPGLLVLVIIMLIALRIIRFLLNRLKKGLVKRAEKDEDLDEIEVEKRIKTLIGIVSRRDVLRKIVRG